MTIPEWTAVFMLNNIESPSLYFQAAFRSQNPYEYEKDGKLLGKKMRISLIFHQIEH